MSVLFAPRHPSLFVHEELAVVGSHVSLDANHVFQVIGHDFTADALQLGRTGQAADEQRGADDGLVAVADTGGHLALFHGGSTQCSLGVGHVDAFELPERCASLGGGPAHDDGAGLLGMELHSIVLDGEVAEGVIYSIGVVGRLASSELRRGACARTGGTDVVAVVASDGQLAVLLPETPYIVGRKGFAAETHTVDGGIIVHHLAGAVGFGRSAGDVVPMLVALGADFGALRTRGGGRFHRDVEVGEQDALAVRTRQGEGDGRFADAAATAALGGRGGDAARAVLVGEGQAGIVVVVDHVEGVAVDHIAGRGSECVSRRTGRAAHQLDVVVRPAHIVGIADEGARHDEQNIHTYCQERHHQIPD